MTSSRTEDIRDWADATLRGRHILAKAYFKLLVAKIGRKEES